MGLRLLTKQDYEHVASLLASYWNRRGLTQFDEAWALGFLQQGHGKEMILDQFFVYKEEKKVIGCVSLMLFEGNVAEIRDLATKEKGEEKEIVLSLVDWAKERGLRKVYALALKERVEMYKELGFSQEGLLKDHFAPGEDLVYVSLFLHS